MEELQDNQVSKVQKFSSLMINSAFESSNLQINQTTMKGFKGLISFKFNY